MTAAAVTLERALRTERTLVGVRWGAVLFGVVQVFTFYEEYPGNTRSVALGFIALLVAGNVALHLHLRSGGHTLRGLRRAGALALALDVTVVMGLVFVYTFDENTMMFALVYLLPLEAALRFQLRGALLTMGVVTGLYTIREAYGHFTFPDVEFLGTSISFRMGIGFLIAYVAGQMAAQLVRDRTELEATQEELERSARELAETNAELATANEIKDDFLAMTNHELRTPLTTILGYTALLRRRWEGIPDERRLEFIARIEEQGLRLQGMVESLLTVTSAEEDALQVRLEDVEVCDAVDEAIGHLGLGGVALINDCAPGLQVRADRVRLGQILVNYLSNARKYGAAPIVVSARQDGRSIVIMVEDHGEGVPDAFVPRLFDKFSQASIGDSRTAEGTGLGLAIVRQLAHAQGGEAWYEPGRAGGAAFLVRLPGTARSAANAS